MKTKAVWSRCEVKGYTFNVAIPQSRCIVDAGAFWCPVCPERPHYLRRRGENGWQPLDAAGRDRRAAAGAPCKPLYRIIRYAEHPRRLKLVAR